MRNTNIFVGPSHCVLSSQTPPPAMTIKHKKETPSKVGLLIRISYQEEMTGTPVLLDTLSKAGPYQERYLPSRRSGLNSLNSGHGNPKMGSRFEPKRPGK